MTTLLSAVQISGTLIVEGLRVLEIHIGIRKLGHPYAFVESADIFTDMACQPLEIAIPVHWNEIYGAIATSCEEVLSPLTASFSPFKFLAVRIASSRRTRTQKTGLGSMILSRHVSELRWSSD